ncbi:MAG TPA: PDZ domain-containing protein [Thermoanaerobaculia bacterium]|nr:PDZ domain-containing protein [Thermoanaerobaculia bacterium]
MKKTLILTSAVLLLAATSGAAVAIDAPDAPQTDTPREVKRVVVKHAEAGTAAGEAAGDDKKVFVVVRGEHADVEGADPDKLVVRRLDVDSPELQRFRVRLGEPGEGGMQWFGDLASRGYLGVSLVELTPELRTHFGAREGAGVMVGRVEPNSPAERAGLQVGDVITHLDGQTVGTTFDLVRKVGERKEGDVVGLEVVRGGRVEMLSATVVERERPQIEARTLLRRLGEGGTAYELDPEALSFHVDSVNEYFSGPEWKKHLEEMERAGELIEKRLQVLEIELDDLEKHIDVEVEMEEDEDAATSDGN